MSSDESASDVIRKKFEGEAARTVYKVVYTLPQGEVVFSASGVGYKDAEVATNHAKLQFAHLTKMYSQGGFNVAVIKVDETRSFYAEVRNG